MKTERKILIATVLVVMILLNCFLPVLKASASTDIRVMFEKNLYLALKDELISKGINAGYIDEQRTIIINEEEVEKVTSLSLSNKELTTIKGIDTFKNLSILDLSSNELNKDSNLDSLNSLNLSSLDLSSNAIEDVSMITNLDNIPTVNLHNQKFNVVQIIELDTTEKSDQKTQVSYALPQILTQAGYLETEWLIEEVTGSAYINWSRFDHRNVKIEVAYKSGDLYIPYKSMVTLRINVSDSKNILYNSDINMFFVVVDSNERGIYMPDENMYKAVKSQLKEDQKINSNLISYYNTTPTNIKRDLYERAYDEPQVLVITINDIINKINSLNLSGKRIKKIDGIEEFVGLSKELDLSGNYIKSIDKLIELQENQVAEEAKLRERVKEQLGKISENISQIATIESSILAENKNIENLEKTKKELEEKIDKLNEELIKLQEEERELKEITIPNIKEEIKDLESEISSDTIILEEERANLQVLKNELSRVLAEKDKYASQKDALWKEYESLKSSTEAERANLENQIANLENLIFETEKEIAVLTIKVNNAYSKYNTNIEQITEKEATLKLKQKDLETSEERLGVVEDLIKQAQKEVGEAEGEIEGQEEGTPSEGEQEEKLEELVAEKEVLESLIPELKIEIDTLEKELEKLIEDRDILQSNYENLSAELEGITDTSKLMEIELQEKRDRLQQVNNKDAATAYKQYEEAKRNYEEALSDYVEKENDVNNCETEISNIDSDIKKSGEAKTKKETELKEKEQKLKEKEKEITDKINQIKQETDSFNSNNNSILESKQKIEKLNREKSIVNDILLTRMSKLYNTYNRIDKLASYAVSGLKTLTEAEFDELTYEQAKSLFNNQIQRISGIENSLTEFEKMYLIDKYGIETEIITEVEKIKQNEDGTTTTVIETKVEKIEKPITKYFEELKSTSEEWGLSAYKNYLNEFREEDIYFSMIAYCYLIRFYEEGMTYCQAEDYVDIEIEELEFDGEDTYYLRNAKNNFASIIDEYNLVCNGYADNRNILPYAARMAYSSADVDVYVCLPRLKALNISENLIENLDRVSELKELRKLNAYDNEIVDISTINWSEMTKLRILNLGLNGISEIDSLLQLVAIEELDLRENLISGSFDFDIAQLENITYLNLSENRIDDIAKLATYLKYEARSYGFDDVAEFLRYGILTVKLNNQELSMKVEEKFEINENKKIQLPKIFRQIEELDNANTSFGINSINGNVTNDGREVRLDTSIEGNFNTIVTIKNTSTLASIGSGTTCMINYTVGTIVPLGVSITPEIAEMFAGETLQFKEEVTGDKVSYKAVRWEVLNATSQNTQITPGGLLKVGEDETAEKIIVKATAMYDETTSAEVEVTIKKKEVNSVNINSKSATVKVGDSIEFTSEVKGNNLSEEDKQVEWNAYGKNGNETVELTKERGTYVEVVEGKLTLHVAKNETLTKIIIVAKSKFDETKFAEIEVTVEKDENTNQDQNEGTKPETDPVESLNLGYKIEGEYIIGVQTKTPVSVFKEKFAKDYTVIVKENNKEITTGNMKTGMYVEVRDSEGNTVKVGEDLLVYEVVVNGDVNGDGVADSVDSNMIKAIRNEVGTVTEIQKRAADIDNNGEIDLTDSKLLLYHRAEVKNYCLDYTK